VDRGRAHEPAIKEAETDAMKRALMTFGNPFGLALYDKQQRQVSTAGGHGEGAQRLAVLRPAVSRPASVPPTPSTASAHSRSAPTDPGQVALNPKTIQQLHHTLRALPRPLLESLTRAFRKRFEVPDTAVTIADRISQKCHHDWIEAFLVSHREVRSPEQHQGAST